MERLFTIIGRINTLLFLLVLLGAATFIAWTIFDSNQSNRRGAIEIADSESGTEKTILLSFGRVENVAGADTQMLPLSSRAKTGKLSSGGYGGETRNVLFLNGSEKAAHWLFKDHKNLILVSDQLHEEGTKTKETPAKALYFEYISDDTNEDGRFSTEDHSNIGLTKPNGTEFAMVLQDVSRVFSFQMLDPQHLSVVYQKGTAVKHAKLSVATMKLISDQELVNVPSTL